MQDEDDLSDLHSRMCLREMEDKTARRRGPYASSLYNVFEKNGGQDCKKKNDLTALHYMTCSKNGGQGCKKTALHWVDSIKGQTAGGLPKFNMQMQDRC